MALDKYFQDDDFWTGLCIKTRAGAMPFFVFYFLLCPVLDSGI